MFVKIGCVIHFFIQQPANGKTWEATVMNPMGTLAYLWVLIVTTSGCFYGSWKNKHNCEEYIPVTIFASAVILYIGGIFHQLSYAVYLLMISSLIVVVGSILAMLCQDGISSLKRLVRPALILYVLVFIILSVTQQKQVSSVPDEASHWMDILRAMSHTNTFGLVPEARSYFGTYPPVLSLIEYMGVAIGQALTGHFMEPLAFLCFQLTALALFVPFLAKGKENNWLSVLLTAIMYFAIPLIYYHMFFSSLGVDGMVGLLAGFCLVYPFCGLDSSLRKVTYCLALFVLCLSKDNGVLFAFVSILMTGLIDWNHFMDDPSQAFITRKQKWVILISAICTVCIAWLSWKLLIAANRPLFSEPWGKTANFGQLFARIDILRSFVSYFFDKAFLYGTIWVHLITVVVLLMICIHIMLGKLGKTCEQKTRNVYIYVLIANVMIYLAGLFLSYMLVFSDVEASGLGSIERYSNTLWLMLTYMAGMLLILLVRKTDQATPKRLVTFSFVLALMVFPYSKFTDTFLEQQLINDAHATRDHYDVVAQNVRESIPESDAVIFLVSQDTGNRDDFWFMRSLLRPLVIDNRNFNLAPQGQLGEEGISCLTKATSEEAMYAQISAERWKEILCESYDYVLLYNLSHTFVTDYGEVFEDPSTISEYTLYEVLDDGMLRYVSFE